MILTRVNKDGRTVRLFSHKTNELIVTETRAPADWRALPRIVQERILSLEQSKKFLVRYQDFAGQYVAGVRCWKCGTPIIGWAPALRKPEGSSRKKQDGELTKVRVNGEDMVLGALLPLNHYREGLYTYRTAKGSLAQFSFLHCADCHVATEHGEDLLACHLGGIDVSREFFKPFVSLSSDDAWAQFMFRWSGIELVGLHGPSLGPKELMEQAKKGNG